MFHNKCLNCNLDYNTFYNDEFIRHCKECIESKLVEMNCKGNKIIFISKITI